MARVPHWRLKKALIVRGYLRYLVLDEARGAEVAQGAIRQMRSDSQRRFPELAASGCSDGHR